MAAPFPFPTIGSRGAHPSNARASQAVSKQGFFQKIGRMFGGDPAAVKSTSPAGPDNFSKRSYPVDVPRELESRLRGQVAARNLPEDRHLLSFLNQVSPVAGPAAIRQAHGGELSRTTPRALSLQSK